MQKKKTKLEIIQEDIEITKEVLKKPLSFAHEFLEFLQKFGVIGFALGIVVGGAVKSVVDSFVKYILDPLLGKILGKVNLSGIEFYDIKIGSFLNDVINFIILMLVVYLAISFFMKRFLTEEDMKRIKV